MKATSFWFKLCLCFVFRTIGTGFSCNALIEKRQIKSGNKCLVPDTEGTQYKFYPEKNNRELIAGTSRVHTTDGAVEVDCKIGYYKNSSAKVYTVCSPEGTWEPKVDKLCHRKCPPAFSDSLDVVCTFNDTNVNCSYPSEPGTVLTPRCKVTHTIPNGQVETPIPLHCQQNGEWSDRLYTCIPLCGKTYVAKQQMVKDGKPAKYGSAPWNVGVYQKNRKNNFDLICGGTLISQNLVVSAAHCFWHDGLEETILHINDSMYKVAVGKYDRDITIMDNEFTRIVDVSFVYLRDRYYGSSGSYAHDLAIIVLPTKVTVSDAVMPVCMDWSLQYPVSNGTIGKVVGWGSTIKINDSPNLLETNLSYIDFHSCLNKYTDDDVTFISVDKFCAGTEMGQAVEHGSGLTFAHTLYSLHFLTGVVSLKSSHTNDSISVFTDIKDHITWISRIYNNFTFASELSNSFLISNPAPAPATRLPPVTATQITEKLSTISAPQYQTSTPTTPFDNMKSKCKVPATEGIVFSIHQTEAARIIRLSPGARVEPDTLVETNCEEGYYRNASSAVLMFCTSNGIWKPKVNKLCIKKCPPVFSDSLDVICKYNGKSVNCSYPSAPGTVLTPTCKKQHFVPNGQSVAQTELHCQQDGRWSGSLYTCIPTCGKPYSVQRSNEANYGSAPWNVAVYRKIKNNNFVMHCGGSLISQNIVVSAANCFWDNILKQKKNADYFKVAVGKYTHDIAIKDNAFTQIVDVKWIIFKGFIGISNNLDANIAIIVLQSEVTFTQVVLPICLDWTREYNVSSGSLGKTVGWIETSSVLFSAIDVRYIDRMECINSPSIVYKKMITNDKFCGGSLTGQGFYFATHGSGLNFVHDNSLHYLTGVLSEDPYNVENPIAIYTDVYQHISWIKEMYNKYS